MNCTSNEKTWINNNLNLLIFLQEAKVFIVSSFSNLTLHKLWGSFWRNELHFCWEQSPSLESCSRSIAVSRDQLARHVSYLIFSVASWPEGKWNNINRQSDAWVRVLSFNYRYPSDLAAPSPAQINSQKNSISVFAFRKLLMAKNARPKYRCDSRTVLTTDSQRMDRWTMKIKAIHGLDVTG